VKVYLAGPWARRDEVREMRDHIHRVAPEIEVISRWIDHVVTNAEDEQRIEAGNDIYDLDHSEAVVVANLEKSEGKSFEQGYAYKSRLPLIVIGERTNVFHHLGSVTIVANVDQAISALLRLHYGARSLASHI